jgi:hypothetical protein
MKLKCSFELLLKYYKVPLVKLIVKYLLALSTSLLFYLVVTFIPEQIKKGNMKKLLKFYYKDMKIKVLNQIIRACIKGGGNLCNGKVSNEEIRKKSEKLLDHREFRKLFFDENNRHNDKWGKFFGIVSDKNNKRYIDDIVKELKLFDKEIDRSILLYPITDKYYKATHYALKNGIKSAIIDLQNFNFNYECKKMTSPCGSY